MKSTEAGLRKTVAVMALSLGMAGLGYAGLGVAGLGLLAHGALAEAPAAQGAMPAQGSAPIGAAAALAVTASDVPDMSAPAAAASSVATMAELLAKSTASAADIEAAQTVVAEVMALTGLPQNFTVVAADVPAITAVILPDDMAIPRRVLVIPQAVLGDLQQAKAAQDWPLLAALSHEIAHHIMGHSLNGGANRPREDREAGFNAGFLLARMGADPMTALTAIDAARAADPAARLAALPQLDALAGGWLQACGEDGGCSQSDPQTRAASAGRPVPRQALAGGDETGDPAARAAKAAQARLDQLRAHLTSRLQPAGDGTGGAAQAGPQDGVSAGSNGNGKSRSGYRLPLPDLQAVPVKFERFVYDPAGLVNEKETASLARDAYAYAQKPGVEIVTIVTDSLHGHDADSYARIMLRQLQVGQQDLGNGVLIVIAPNEGSSAVAMGAGVISAITAAPSPDSPTSGDEALATMRSRAAAFVETLGKGGDPKVPTVAMALTEAAHAVMRSPDVANAEWFVRYGSLDAALAAQEADWSARAKSGAGYDPAKDPVGRRILRLRAEIIGALDAETAAGIDPEQLRLFGPAIALRDDRGETQTLFVPPVAMAAASAPLVAGRRYEIVARVVENGGDKPLLALMGYDDLTPLP